MNLGVPENNISFLYIYIYMSLYHIQQTFYLNTLHQASKDIRSPKTRSNIPMDRQLCSQKECPTKFKTAADSKKFPSVRNQPTIIVLWDFYLRAKFVIIIIIITAS